MLKSPPDFSFSLTSKIVLIYKGNKRWLIDVYLSSTDESKSIILVSIATAKHMYSIAVALAMDLRGQSHFNEKLTGSSTSAKIFNYILAKQINTARLIHHG